LARLTWRPFLALSTLLRAWTAARWSAKFALAWRARAALTATILARLRGCGVRCHEPELPRRGGTACALDVEQPYCRRGDLDSVITVEQRFQCQHLARGNALRKDDRQLLAQPRIARTRS